MAIHDLGLGNVENSRIGDENSRGISGGQRKRVNVGIEMVASAPEPTPPGALVDQGA